MKPTRRERDRRLIAEAKQWRAIESTSLLARSIFAVSASNDAYKAAARELNRIAREVKGRK